MLKNMFEKELIINDFKIKYFEKQDTGGAVFVFLHGWGSSYKAFSLIYRELSNFIALDFPGFGGSSRPERILKLSDYAELAENFIRRKLGGKKIIFVAHSFGGRVLLKLLLRNNVKNIKQIICVGVPFFRRYGNGRKAVYWATKIFKVIALAAPESAARAMRKYWYKIIGAGDYAALENEIMKGTFRNIINEDIAKISYILKNYKTDFIWGSDDSEAPLSEAEIISKKTGANLYIIKNGGHFPFVGETAEEFNNIFKKITQT